MSLNLEDPYLLLEVIGTVAFAVSGAAVGVRAGMDWLGISVLAGVTAIGGGTVRDLLLDRPVGWLESPWPIWLALATAVIVIVEAYIRPMRPPDTRLLILIADAAGLAVFAVSGAGLALQAGTGGTVAVMMGVVTGVGGGVLRDLLARQRPLVLYGQIYALTALAGVSVFILLNEFEVGQAVARWSAVAVIFVLRLLAIRYRWTLPRPPRPGVLG